MGGDEPVSGHGLLLSKRLSHQPVPTEPAISPDEFLSVTALRAVASPARSPGSLKGANSSANAAVAAFDAEQLNYFTSLSNWLVSQQQQQQQSESAAGDLTSGSDMTGQ